jgi:thermitase
MRMGKSTILLLTVVAALLFAFSGVVLAQQTDHKQNDQGEQTDRADQGRSAGDQSESEEFVAGEVLVKFKPGTRGQAQAEAHRQAAGRVKQNIPGVEVKVIGVAAGTERTNLARYQRNPNVEFAELNGIYEAIETIEDTTNSGDESTSEKTDGGATSQQSPDATTNATKPTDSYYAKQWQYPKIKAPDAWDLTKGSNSVPIAILDTGISQSHPDLANKVTQSKGFTSKGEADTDDKNGHGSHVAGSAAAATDNGTMGVAGTCWNCPLWNYKVLGDNGSGSYSAIASGVTRAADNGAKVISMSLGGEFDSQTVHDAVNYAYGFQDDGITPYRYLDKNDNEQVSPHRATVVAAAGNDGKKNATHYPSNYKNVISVAATNKKDTRANYSNYGKQVDVAAPGSSIYSTYKGSGHKTLSGTSMATPHVAGVAGLVWSTSLCPDSDSKPDNSCVRDRIETKADRIKGTGTLWGTADRGGRINAYKSVSSP